MRENTSRSWTYLVTDEVIRGHWVVDPKTGELCQAEKPVATDDLASKRAEAAMVPIVKR